MNLLSFLFSYLSSHLFLFTFSFRLFLLPYSLNFFVFLFSQLFFFFFSLCLLLFSCLLNSFILLAWCVRWGTFDTRPIWTFIDIRLVLSASLSVQGLIFINVIKNTSTASRPFWFFDVFAYYLGLTVQILSVARFSWIRSVRTSYSVVSYFNSGRIIIDTFIKFHTRIFFIMYYLDCASSWVTFSATSIAYVAALWAVIRIGPNCPIVNISKLFTSFFTYWFRYLPSY